MNWKARYKTLKVGDKVKIIKILKGCGVEENDSRYIRLIGECFTIKKIIGNGQMELNSIPGDTPMLLWGNEELEKVN